MTDGDDPGAPWGAGGTAGPAGDKEKRDVAAALDLRSVHWSRPRDEAGTEIGRLEYAFVPHDDGVTYVVLRSVGRCDERTVLVFTPSEWDAFLAGARDGEFDRPQD